MDASSIFSFGNSFVLLGWILLIFTPNWKLTQPIVLYGIILVLSIIYAFMVLSTISNFNPDSFSTLANVKALFQDEKAVAAGWMHYLAFDLFVGAYVVREGKNLEISRWLYTLCLPFTFMFGPIGYLLFTIVRLSKK
jgi:hypothetical protein